MVATLKKAVLKNEKKAKEEARDRENQLLIDARGLAEKYHVTFTDLDTYDEIMSKIDKAKTSGVVADGAAPPEIKKTASQSKKGPQFEDLEITSPDELDEHQGSGKIAGFSGWFLEKENSEGNVERIPSKNNVGEFGFTPGAKAIVRVALSVLLAVGLSLGGLAFAASSTDEAVLGNDRWSVDSSGNLVPNANTYKIGSATQYPASIWVNGAEYTSFAAGTDGNFTNNGLTTTLDSAPTKFILTHSSGDMFATGFTVDSGDITFANGQKIDGDTNAYIKLIEAGDTLTFGFDGSDITLDTSDGGFVFLMTQADGYVTFKTTNDSDDYMYITTTSNVPTIMTAGTSNLAIAPDGGTVAITGAITASSTITATGGLVSSTTVTLQNSETIVNSTNNTVEIGGGTNTVLSILDTGTSDSDATLLLRADASADNGDDWQIVSDGATNSLLIQNDTSGTMATKFTLTTAGVITFGGAVTLSNDDTITNATDDTIRVASNDTHTVLDVYSGYATDGTAAINLIGDAQADATDSFQIKNNADGTLTFANDSSAAGTYVTKLTLSSAGALTATGIVSNTNATDASSLTVASTVLSGGLAVTKQLYIGDDIDMSVNGTGVYDITLKDSVADALSIVRGTTDMIVFDSSTPKITITPVTTITGRVNADGGLDRSTAAGLAIGATSATSVTITPATTVTGILTASASINTPGDVTFQTSLLAGGRFGASSTIASSSSGIRPGTIPYSLLMKAIGNNLTTEASTLPAGTSGQILAIRVIACGPSGTWTITPGTTSSSISSMVFNAVNDYATLMYDATQGWILLGSESVTVTLKGINTP